MKTACFVGAAAVWLAFGAMAYAGRDGAREGRKPMVERKNYASLGSNGGLFSSEINIEIEAILAL